MFTQPTLCRLAFILPAACFSCTALAQTEYPNRPIRFIMPYPVGGSIDFSGRVIAQQLGDNLGQQIVVDNRTGAGGTLGSGMAARAAPDGYTIMMSTARRISSGKFSGPRRG